MGAYWTLSIKGYSVLEGKNTFDGAMLQLFRREDARIERTNSPHAEYNEYNTYEYTSTVAEMRERLDLMGFTAERTAKDFERGRAQELGREDDPRSKYAHFLRGYKFDDWLTVMAPLLRKGRHQLVESNHPHVGSVKEFICSYDNEHALLGFFTSDPRFVLRGCLEAAPARCRVRLNLADLVNGGYLDDDPYLYEVFTDAAIEYARTSPVVVLTEGSSDRWVLEGTLRLVYPHLTGFFSFMDFESSNAPGGAGQLVATVKAFIGSRIRSRILAVFDNDTAAHAALRGLKEVVIPPNIRCCRLPDLRWARQYPTVGPQGRLAADINGKACSLELFLGPDILGRGKSRTVVHWGSFDQGMRQYQGEVDSKKSLLDRFRVKLGTATRAQVRTDPAWRDIRYLWAYLKSQAEAISLDMIDATEAARASH